MAKHEIKIHENTSPTKEVAQYLGSYITKTTVSLAQLCKSAAELSGVPELKLQTLIENDIDAFIDLERKGACRIHVDGGYVELRILGKFSAADSAWDPAKNALVVAFTPDDEIRNHLINECRRSSRTRPRRRCASPTCSTSPIRSRPSSSTGATSTRCRATTSAWTTSARGSSS